MNKKILTIIFTLFVAGLLTVSCSSKDKTGPGSDNGGGTTGLPTGIQDGEGTKSSYRQYKYAPEDGKPIILMADGQKITFTTENEFQLSVADGSKYDEPNLNGEYVGGILIKMPKLKDLGFTSDVIRVLPKNIRDNNFSGVDIHAVYLINDTDEKLEYVELKTTGIQFNANFITMNSDITFTKTTKEKKDGKTTTITYTIPKEGNDIRRIESALQITPIPVEGNVIDPNNK